MITPIRNLALTCAALGSLASLQADTFTNIATNPSGGSTWNTTAFWSSNPDPVSSGNDYQMNPDPVRVDGNNPIGTAFTVQVGAASTAWRYFGYVRDYNTSAPAADSTFLGDKLILTENAAFRSFNRNFTSEATWEMQSGSFMFLNAGASGTTTAWNGSITTEGTTAIGLITNNETHLTVNASIAGTGTLSLVQSGGSIANLNLNGDISLFTGTLLLSGSTQVNPNSRTFSIANSATFATLQLNWQTSAFYYDLADNNVSFASLILTDELGANNVLGIGTYDAVTLNSLTGDSGIFFGAGTITVVPEPSTYALAMVGLLAMLVMMHRRRQQSLS